MSNQDSSDVTALEFSRRKLLVAGVGALAIGAAAPARAEITKAGFRDLPPLVTARFLTAFGRG